MLNYLTLILCCQLAGEFVVKSLSLPLPGPVLGMAFLFGFLVIRGEIPVDLAAVSNGLLNHLSLLFVPAGVGVMLHFQLLQNDWLVVGSALLISTLLTVAVTAMVMVWLGRRDNDDPQSELGNEPDG